MKFGIFAIIINLLAGAFFSAQSGASEALKYTLKEGDPLSLISFDIPQIPLNPIKKRGYVAPLVKASSVVVVDDATNKKLFAQSENEPRPIASITKVATAMVVLNRTQNLNEIVMVPTVATQVGGAKMNLIPGERITVLNLLKGLLIASANDAALALAIHTGEDETRFVSYMNDLVKELNLRNTHFVNPHGFDVQGHYSTAYDIAELTRYALRNEAYRNIIHTRYAVVTDISGRFGHPLENTNELLNSYLNIEGGKTGTTSKAGESLVVSATGDRGQRIIAVLLNSPDRFQEGKVLLDWALRAYEWL